MSVIHYNKLVRDGIPGIIRGGGKDAEISHVSGELKRRALRMKLLEEVRELYQARSDGDFVKEAADVLEVLRALVAEVGVDWDAVESAAARRCGDRGGFLDGVFLHCVFERGEESPGHGEPMVSLPRLITPESSPSLLEQIKSELVESSVCRLASAFVSRGAVNLLVRPFTRFLDGGGNIRLLTSVMNDFNEPEVFRHLNEVFPECETRVFFPGYKGAESFSRSPVPFHLKCFMFEKPGGHNSLLIGSSNLTHGGLAGNHEWNLFENLGVNIPFAAGDDETVFESAARQFDQHWERDAVAVSAEFIDAYSERIRRRPVPVIDIDSVDETVECHPEPSAPQEAALRALAVKRLVGIGKTAVIAATGLGKTHLAAFDFERSGFSRVLFVAHRVNILSKARDTFRSVLGIRDFGLILAGDTPAFDLAREPRGKTGVFAMVQSLCRPANLAKYAPDCFDYIVIDEFHHAEAESYRRLINHFRPKFLLGMTATPERMDGRDVLRFCDYDVAYEARLFDAIESGWLCPFQYFAIFDSTNYSAVRWTGLGYDEAELEKALNRDTRARLVVENLGRFMPAVGKVKALAFCATVGHARYMAEAFSRAGWESAVLTGDSPETERDQAIRDLRDDSHPLKIICSVDIFSEGVDIPCVSHILMLRPTQSFTVFLQQLGRGLRKAPGKDYVVVLDFIGNYRNSYVAPLVVRGFHSVADYRARKDGGLFSAPKLCAVDYDLAVERIWDDEIARVVKPRNRREHLTDLYMSIRKNLGGAPGVLDFFANPEEDDPSKFIKEFGSWLGTKKAMGDLSPFEESLVDGPGAFFLEHLESELRPNRSYKMVVLLSLLRDGGRIEWTTREIAERFMGYYLENRRQLLDCSVMAKHENPELTPVAEVERLLRDMPLKRLSKPDDCFTFDPKRDVFSLKDEFAQYWGKAEFRELALDRVNYALKKYFHGKEREAGFEGCVEGGAATAAEATKPNLPVSPPEEEVPEVLEWPVSFFPELKLACGAFIEGNPEGAATIVIHNRKADSKRHFVVRAAGDSMDGGANPISDGDFLLMEWMSPSSAGSISSGPPIAVEYLDPVTGESSYALKSIVKDGGGNYFLRSRNRKYPDIPVDTANCRTFARFVRKLESDEFSME